MRRVKPNLLDRVIATVSPAAGLRRLAARASYSALAGHGYYEGGRGKRRSLVGWSRPKGSADADTVPDLDDLRADSRQLVRTTPISS